MTTHYNVTDLGLDGLNQDDLEVYIVSDSIADLQDPDDLADVLYAVYGTNFRYAAKEEKFVLISLVSTLLVEGGRLCDLVESRPIARSLPQDVRWSELDHSTGFDLLKKLVSSVSEDFV